MVIILLIIALKSCEVLQDGHHTLSDWRRCSGFSFENFWLVFVMSCLAMSEINWIHLLALVSASFSELIYLAVGGCVLDGDDVGDILELGGWLFSYAWWTPRIYMPFLKTDVLVMHSKVRTLMNCRLSVVLRRMRYTLLFGTAIILMASRPPLWLRRWCDPLHQIPMWRLWRIHDRGRWFASGTAGI